MWDGQGHAVKIFEPFFTTKDMGKGTGLGLATAYGIVKQNNGFINVYSELGTGTTFKIYFPYCQDSITEDEMPAACSMLPASHETILLVEDEPTLLKINEELVAELGYAVLAADTPESAIRLAKEHQGRLDLMLTDVMMPHMNGRDLERLIRQIHPEMICLFTSGYTASVISNHGVLDSDVNFIQKPFTFKELQAKISECLHKR
jgi:two-component system, cell cycle sensor histidine kinase and response regulator CckA